MRSMLEDSKIILRWFSGHSENFYFCTKITPWQFCWKQCQSGLVPFKSCKLESKTRAKVFGKVDMMETYQHDTSIFIANIHNQQLKRFIYTQVQHVYASKWLRDHTTIFIDNSQKDSDIHMFSMFMHRNDWDHSQYDPWTNFNYLGFRLVNGVQSEVLLAKINACTSKLPST